MANETTDTSRDVKVKVSGGDSSGEWVPETINIVPTVGALRQYFNVPANTTILIDGRRYEDDTAVLPEEGDRYLYVGWETNNKTGGNA